MGIAVRSMRHAQRIARLRRVSVLGVAAALALSLPTLGPLSPADAVGPTLFRAEADATSNANGTATAASAADASADAGGTAGSGGQSNSGASVEAAGGADAGAAGPGPGSGSGSAADAAAAGAGTAGTASSTASGDASTAAAADGGTGGSAGTADADGTGGDPNAPRGPNGGVASDSPGPENQQTPDGSEQQRMRAFADAASALRGDDYPARYRNLPWPYQNDNIWDEWNFAYRQCTSFVAWRLNSANGVPFSNQYMGLYRWGNAGEWADSARSVGIRVDRTPEIGAVAWSGAYYGDASQFGHVAWVADVLGDGRVVIEEYNAGWAGAYSTRTVPATQFQGYIHIKDIYSPFDRTGAASVVGAPMVNGTLTATASGWAPAATSYTYRWMRNGSVIPGATGSSYQPTFSDLGAKLSVEVTGNRARYRASSATSGPSAAVMMADVNGDGIDDTQQMLPWNSDVNGDGLPDAVGFGGQGVYVALRTGSGFAPEKRWVSGFGTSDGWTTASHPRTLVDVNGDGKADVVGFGRAGVTVATSTGTGFTAPKVWLADFGTAAGWSVKSHPRTLADVTGDGIPDVVGFNSDGVYVAVGTGTGFKAAERWYAGFGTDRGWTVDEDPRWLEDMNGDGRADIVGISNAGVYVALSTGSGFASAKQWSSGFGSNAGWNAASQPRMLADVNGDGRLDVVGFNSDGVDVALNSGGGLLAPTRWRAGFGTKTGWQSGQHPRVLADVNGDGRADIVGFSPSQVTVSLSTGSGFGAPQKWSGEFASSAWSADAQPRLVTDVNGDGKADIAAFDAGGVRIALSTGSGFADSQLQLASLGSSAGGWSVRSHPRAIRVQSLQSISTPTVAGTARVGETLTASVAAVQPAPVQQVSQWLRNGSEIPGATSMTYTLAPEDAGTRVTFRTRGSKFAYAPLVRSSAPVDVAPGIITAGEPRISGVAQSGGTLRVNAGAWAPSSVKLSYQWARNGTPISGATQAQLRLSSADVGRRISVIVTGAQSGYTSESRETAMVRVPGTPPLPSDPPFADVSYSHKFYREIAWMHSSGMSTGVRQEAGKPLYQPSSEVSREAMAAFLFRLSAPHGYQPPAASPFVDIAPSQKFYREIAWMYDSGLSTGIASGSGRRFDAKAPVSREAMAAFLYRLESPSGYRAPAESPFADVETSHKFYREIAWMSDSKLSTGTRQPSGKPLYKAQDGVSREAMAAFLYRLETQAQ